MLQWVTILANHCYSSYDVIIMIPSLLHSCVQITFFSEKYINHVIVIIAFNKKIMSTEKYFNHSNNYLDQPTYPSEMESCPLLYLPHAKCPLNWPHTNKVFIISTYKFCLSYTMMKLKAWNPNSGYVYLLRLSNMSTVLLKFIEQCNIHLKVSFF